MLELLGEPLIKGCRPMEAENWATGGVWFEKIGKAGLDACALVFKRQWSPRAVKVIGYAFAVLGCLDLDARERVAFLLGFYNSNWRAIHEKRVVRSPCPDFSGNSRTATPRPAERFVAFLS